jgi:putative ABC transport system permease protein
MMTPPPAARPVRIGDIVELSLSSLRPQKVRTALTVVGVVVGTFTLIISLAVGQGVDHAIIALFHENDRLRTINVRTHYEAEPSDIPEDERVIAGAMSASKRDRLVTSLVRRWGRDHPRQPKARLTRAALERLKAIDHVKTILPSVAFFGARAVLDDSEATVTVTAVPSKTTFFRDRLIAGTLYRDNAARVAVVHEYLLYQWGLAGDAEAAKAVGRKFRLEYHAARPRPIPLAAFLSGGAKPPGWKEVKTLKRALERLAVLLPFLPMSSQERAALRRVLDHLMIQPGEETTNVYSEEFTVIGVIRERLDGDEKPGFGSEWLIQEADILLPTDAAAAFYLRSPENADEGFGDVNVIVDEEKNVQEVANRITALGYDVFSLEKIIETVRMNVFLITLATAFVAVVALLVAALGITNTMIMSVLERTHEIGIMKAIGARDRHIQLIFLVEGAVLGLAGGLLDLGLSWLASFPANAIAKSIMEEQTQEPIRGSLLLFPTWLVLGAPALACLITTAAALYPAVRAARVDPMTSLRRE